MRRLAAGVGLRGDVWFVPTACTTASTIATTVSSRASPHADEEACWRETEIAARPGTAGSIVAPNSQRFEPDEPESDLREQVAVDVKAPSTGPRGCARAHTHNRRRHCPTGRRRDTDFRLNFTVHPRSGGFDSRAQEILADIRNFTDQTPVTQFSEVVTENSAKGQIDEG